MNERNLPIAEERYRALPLIRRLLTEQGLVHWRKYAIAFTLMAVSAGCTAFSAYLIGDVINQAYVNRSLPGIIVTWRNHCRPVFGEGPRHIRPQRDAVAHRQSNCRGQSARGFFEAAQRRARLLLGPPFNRIHRPSFDRRRGRNASHQSAHYLGRTRPALADRTGHGDGGAGSAAVVLQLCRGSSRILRSSQIDPAHLFDCPHASFTAGHASSKPCRRRCKESAS